MSFIHNIFIYHYNIFFLILDTELSSFSKYSILVSSFFLNIFRFLFKHFWSLPKIFRFCFEVFNKKSKKSDLCSIILTSIYILFLFLFLFLQTFWLRKYYVHYFPYRIFCMWHFVTYFRHIGHFCVTFLWYCTLYNKCDIRTHTSQSHTQVFQYIIVRYYTIHYTKII